MTEETKPATEGVPIPDEAREYVLAFKARQDAAQNHMLAQVARDDADRRLEEATRRWQAWTDALAQRVAEEQGIDMGRFRF